MVLSLPLQMSATPFFFYGTGGASAPTGDFINTLRKVYKQTRTHTPKGEKEEEEQEVQEEQ